MIYTITFNPSLDYFVRVPQLRLGLVNRAEHEALYPGGKGVNVSIVLTHLGIESRTLGFKAGFTGQKIDEMLRSCGCKTDFIQLPDGASRINVKLESDQETDINGQGPRILPEAIDALMEKLDVMRRGDILVLAGSIPNTLPEDIYQKILARLSGRQILAVVDATGKLLQNVLEYRPFLIKPNHHELGELFGVQISDADVVAVYAEKLEARGARNVLVSMGGGGAVLLDETGRVHKSAAPKGEVRGAVGAGDSMVAGFLAGYLRAGDYEKAFKLGLAAGSASAFSEWLATGEEIRKLLDNGF